MLKRKSRSGNIAVGEKLVAPPKPPAGADWADPDGAVESAATFGRAFPAPGPGSSATAFFSGWAVFIGLLDFSFSNIGHLP